MARIVGGDGGSSMGNGNCGPQKMKKNLKTTFGCERCGMKFGRRDMLLRHKRTVRTCSSSAGVGGPSPSSAVDIAGVIAPVHANQPFGPAALSNSEPAALQSGLSVASGNAYEPYDNLIADDLKVYPPASVNVEAYFPFDGVDPNTPKQDSGVFGGLINSNDHNGNASSHVGLYTTD